jgi:AhpC/TSA family protein
MKRVRVALSMIALSAVVLVGCKDKGNNQDTAIGQENHKHGPEGKHHEGDRKGPPHGGDRKGPPKGGSPEQTKTLEEIGGCKIGEVATDFNLKNVDGSMVSLASIENAKGYIVTFTCNECPFSKLYEDRLIELHNTYAPQGYSVIAINPNSPENERISFCLFSR